MYSPQHSSPDEVDPARPATSSAATPQSREPSETEPQAGAPGPRRSPGLSQIVPAVRRASGEAHQGFHPQGDLRDEGALRVGRGRTRDVKSAGRAVIVMVLCACVVGLVWVFAGHQVSDAVVDRAGVLGGVAGIAALAVTVAVLWPQITNRHSGADSPPARPPSAERLQSASEDLATQPQAKDRRTSVHRRRAGPWIVVALVLVLMVALVQRFNWW